MGESYLSVISSFPSHKTKHRTNSQNTGCVFLTGKLLSNNVSAQFADAVEIFLNENLSISHKILLKFVPKIRVDNIQALVQIMAWRRPGDKPLSESMTVTFLAHICITRPQRVKQNKIGFPSIIHSTLTYVSHANCTYMSRNACFWENLLNQLIMFHEIIRCRYQSDCRESLAFEQIENNYDKDMVLSNVLSLV